MGADPTEIRGAWDGAGWGKHAAPYTAEAPGCSLKQNVDLVHPASTQSALNLSLSIGGNGLHGWAEQAALEQ